VHDVPYFDRFAPIYDRVLPGTDSAPLEAGLALATREVGCVLDLGGGTGRAARALPDDSLVLDASLPMLFRARDFDLETVRGDVRTLPLGPDVVDGVVIVDALHHFPAVERAITEASRVLRPGGALVIREFDPTTLRGRALVWGEKLVGFASTFFTPADVESMLREAGLEPRVLERGFVYTVAGVKPDAIQEVAG
jgi:demethylmenaquinone methyltransferase/2-methoxy-6-polyprenyl-1,4-benzoquinol methylase